MAINVSYSSLPQVTTEVIAKRRFQEAIWVLTVWEAPWDEDLIIHKGRIVISWNKLHITEAKVPIVKNYC